MQDADGFQQEMQTKDVAENMSRKILEIQDCLVDTKEVSKEVAINQPYQSMVIEELVHSLLSSSQLIETLLHKQQDLTEHIEQLKEMASVRTSDLA